MDSRKHQEANFARTEGVFVFTCYLLISAVLVWFWDKIADPDSFYHFAHALAYKEAGTLAQTFQWTRFSATGLFQADLWLGIHVFALPFTFTIDPVLGLKLSIAGWMFTCLVVGYFAFKRLKISLAFVGPLLILFSGPLETGRLIALRPQMLSMFLFIFLLAVLLKPGRKVEPFLIGLSLGIFHQTVSWLILPLVLFFGLGAFLYRKDRSVLWEALFSIGGVIIAWLIRPGATDAVKLMRIQILELGSVKTSGIPLPFGSEVYIFTTNELIQHFGFFAIVWLGLGLASVFLIHKSELIKACPEKVTIFGLSFTTSLGFYILLMSESTRGLEYWVAFSAVSILVSCQFIFAQVPELKKVTLERLGYSALGFFLLVFNLPTLNSFFTNIAIDPYRYKPVMEVVSKQSKVGELVWTADWENFGQYYFWNRKNVFVQGMDPIFLHSARPDLSWSLLYLRSGKDPTRTFLGRKNQGAREVSSGDLIRKEFGASFAYVQEGVTPGLTAVLAADPNFTEVFRDQSGVLFKVIQE
jgi:hypothetical protein